MKLFEELTSPLSGNEKKLLPLLARTLGKCRGKGKAMTNKQLQECLRPHAIKLGLKINAVRVRKMINHLRIFNELTGLLACSRGYYVCYTCKEIDEYIASLWDRESAIYAVRQALARQKKEIKKNLKNAKRYER